MTAPSHASPPPSNSASNSSTRPRFFSQDSGFPPIRATSTSLHRRKDVEQACNEIFLHLGPPTSARAVQVQQAESAASFHQHTGRPTFEAAAVYENTLWLQPEEILKQQTDVQAIFRHECTHLWFRMQTVQLLPPLLEEVFALGISGQAARIPPASKLAGKECIDAEYARAHPLSRTTYEHWMHRAVATFGGALAGLSVEEVQEWLHTRREQSMASRKVTKITTTKTRAATCEEIGRQLPKPAPQP